MWRFVKLKSQSDPVCSSSRYQPRPDPRRCRNSHRLPLGSTNLPPGLFVGLQAMAPPRSLPTVRRGQHQVQEAVGLLRPLHQRRQHPGKLGAYRRGMDCTPSVQWIVTAGDPDNPGADTSNSTTLPFSTPSLANLLLWRVSRGEHLDDAITRIEPLHARKSSAIHRSPRTHNLLGQVQKCHRN